MPVKCYALLVAMDDYTPPSIEELASLATQTGADSFIETNSSTGPVS